jgi:hypothetical protein
LSSDYHYFDSVSLCHPTKFTEQKKVSEWIFRKYMRSYLAIQEEIKIAKIPKRIQRKFMEKKGWVVAGSPWLTPVILTTQEEEIRRIMVHIYPRQTVCETLF